MENGNSLILRQLDNVFLIDWLTITFHKLQPHDVQHILGMRDCPWSCDRTFVNGYPLDLSCGHIHIRYGADDPQFYDDPKKARSDMGISLDMSGQGCREFETYSSKSWLDFIRDVIRCGGVLGATYKVTRLDLAYDDHSGLLNIWQIKRDVEDRNYISKSKKSTIIWSDDQETDILGLTIEIGSRKSDVLIRIYDKAAERGYKSEKHWIRIEMQLRHDRAQVALQRLFQRESIGLVASGILRNYCMFVSPTSDSNRARWPIADYWQRILDGMEKLRIWIAPGEEYNFSKTENQLVFQYGQAMQVIYELAHHDLNGFYLKCCDAYPNLKPKYERVLNEHRHNLKVAKEERERIQAEIDDLRCEMGYDDPDAFLSGYDVFVQSHFAELLVDDPSCPFGGIDEK